MDHKCAHEADFGKLVSQVEDLRHSVYGNGKEGLNVIVPKLALKLDSLSEQMEKNSTLVSAVYKFMEESEVEKRISLETTKQKQRHFNILISVITAVIALTVLLVGQGIVRTEKKISYFEKVGPNTYIQTRRGDWEQIDSAYWDKSYLNGTDTNTR